MCACCSAIRQGLAPLAGCAWRPSFPPSTGILKGSPLTEDGSKSIALLDWTRQGKRISSTRLDRQEKTELPRRVPSWTERMIGRTRFDRPGEGHASSRTLQPGKDFGIWDAGLDWADQHHDLVVIDETGRKVGQLRVEHNPEGLARLVKFLKDMAPLDHIAGMVETLHGLLISTLLEAGVAWYPVNPKTVGIGIGPILRRPRRENLC